MGAAAKEDTGLEVNSYGTFFGGGGQGKEGCQHLATAASKSVC